MPSFEGRAEFREVFMARLRELIRRIWGTLRRNPGDAQLEREIQAHLELAADELQRHGRSREEAMRAARLRHGSVAQTMDAMRDQRGVSWLDDLARDVRHGLRVLGQSPTFTIVAILTLALGIGANTAIFSVVNGVILRPLAYPKPQQLMHLTTRFGAAGFNDKWFWVSAPEYLELRELNQSFSAVGAYIIGEANLTADDRPRRVRAAYVDDHLLAALGVQPERGRLFGEGETDVTGPPPERGQPAPLAPPIAILSHDLWQTAFGSQPIIGKTVEVDARQYSVIGVLPPGADLMDRGTEVWLPLGLNPANRQLRANHYLSLIARLKDGVTPRSAQLELDSLMANWGERVGLKPGSGAAGHVFSPLIENGGHILQMKPLQEEVVGGVSRSIWMLQAAVGFVLLIACANLANLLLARAQTRYREFSVRTALGAGRGRLFRQLMTEGVLLSVAGGGLGLLLARLGVTLLILSYPNSLPRSGEIALDPSVLLFTLTVSIASGLLFGTAPMLHGDMRDLAGALKESSAKGSIGGRHHHLRKVLVVAEAALSLILVIAAGLLLRTLYNLNSVDTGFDRSRLITFSITLPQTTYRLPSARLRTYQPLLEKLRALPGVQGGSGMSGLPPARPHNSQDITVENYTPPPGGPYQNVDYMQNIMSDYFETMRIPIVLGRGFQRADATSGGRSIVINETFAQAFFKDQDPIGRRVRGGAGDQIPWSTVIGVARDVKQGGIDQKTGSEIYVLLDQVPPATPQTLNVVLRTTLPPQALSRNIENIVREADRTVPIVRLREMDDVFAESNQRPRLLAELVGGFAALALVLAAIGTYGVLSYIVAQRRREIGIRIALGAHRKTVLGHIMKEGLLLTIAGLIAGLAGAFAMNRLIVSLLFGVQPTDGPTLALATLTIAFVAAGACWLPAWRASRLDPNTVLRDE
jgi:predicted permease